MKPDGEFKMLFQPGMIGNLQLKNRIVMAPMGNRLCGLWGEVNDSLIDWYVRRSQGGTALIIVEATACATAIDRVRHMPRSLRADDDAYCSGLAQLAEAVHDAGAKISIQLSPGMGAEATFGSWTPGLQYIDDPTPVGPSTVPSPMIGIRPRELTIEEIQKIVKLMGYAAERVKRAGFDSLEIHGHGGYLLAQFMSPYYNKRIDRYGGNLDGRMRLTLEIIDSIRQKVGPDFPVTIKYAIEESIEGGRDLKEGVSIAQRLEEAGIDGIEVSRGFRGMKGQAAECMYSSEGYMVPLAEALKKSVKIPIILSGRLGNPLLAEQVLQEGKADFIAMGRPLIADPDLPDKASEGRSEEILRCICCNECMDIMARNKMTIRCSLNPVAGRESRYGIIKPAPKAKKVLVIGAGPAGMEAARVATLKGHNVTLYEKKNELAGGQVKLASVAPYKEPIRYIADYYSAIFKKLNNIRVELGNEVTIADILKENPDSVVIATGGKPLIPDIPGIDGSNVVTAYDVLAGKSEVGETVVIAGGGSVGCETAHFLVKQGKNVTIVEMLEKAGADMEGLTWEALYNELVQGGTRILTESKIDLITNDGVTTIDNMQNRSQLKADTVIIALGVSPVNELAEELAATVKELHIIGDARKPGKIRGATSNGFITAFNNI